MGTESSLIFFNFHTLENPQNYASRLTVAHGAIFPKCLLLLVPVFPGGISVVQERHADFRFF